MGIILAIAASLAGVVYGALLFAGNEWCYRLLAGGDSFLALNPSDVALKRSARQSAVATWMIVVALWCTLARAYMPLGEAFDIAILVAAIAAGIVIVVVVILQVRQYVHLLKERRG